MSYKSKVLIAKNKFLKLRTMIKLPFDTNRKK